MGRQHLHPVSALQVNSGPRHQQRGGWARVGGGRGWVLTYQLPTAGNQGPGDSHMTHPTPSPQQIKSELLRKPHLRLALAMFLNHLWLREVECLLISSSDDSWTRQSPFPQLIGQSIQRVLNPLRTKVASRCHQLRCPRRYSSGHWVEALGSAQGFPDPLLSWGSPLKTLYQVVKGTGTGGRSLGAG